MVSRRAWEAYPQTYRAREMEILANWIRAGESGSVIGLAGAGKSNMLGFLCHQPQVMAGHYSQDSPLRLALILVDLNDLPGDDLSTFYRMILRSLYEARSQLATIDKVLPDNVQDLYHRVENEMDPFVSQSALREILLSFREKGARLVLVLDPFDQFYRAVTPRILDNLRGLRDSFKTTLSYIVGLRHELAYIRDPANLGELYEILDTHVCWLGPMHSGDAAWVINQVEEGMCRSFDDEQVNELIKLTGGYPTLLRAAALWLAQIAPIPDTAVWEEQLLTEPSIRNRLRDIWYGLTGEEQLALSVLHTALSVAPGREQQKSIRQIEKKHHSALARLQAKHLCANTDTGWKIFSPLLATFIASAEGISAGRIWCDPKTARFFQGEEELTSLSELDRRLLRHFLKCPLTVHSIDDLIATVWGEHDSEGVSNAAVQQAIRHLRTQIELNPARPCYLITQRGVGYRFFPEGAPRA
jgi:hypothetical protein